MSTKVDVQRDASFDHGPIGCSPSSARGTPFGIQAVREKHSLRQMRP